MSTGSKTSGSGSVVSEATSLANPITYYKTITGLYPNNAEVWWAMKRPPELGSDAPPKIYLEVFDPSLRYQVGTGNTPVSKGHYILPAFQQDRAASSGVAGLPVKSANGFRPSCTAFYAGRVFFAGVNTAEFNTKIYFSAILERPDQVGQMFQIEDPTSEDLHDLLPSDGGVVDIPELQKVYNMVPYGSELFVFASNGVWDIGGSSGTGFRANDYSVSKLSGTQTLANLSFVSVDGAPMWWNLSGIYTISPNNQGQYQVVCLTDGTIKSLFEDIPDKSKLYAKGAYDPLTKRVQYLYRSTEADTDAEQFIYDKILTFDVRTNAFSPWEAPSDDKVLVKGIFDLVGAVQESLTVDVSVDDDKVVVGSDQVVSDKVTSHMIESKIKYIVNVVEP